MDKISKKGLILVFRGESSDDFKEIAKRAYKLDPDVRILGFSEVINLEKIPPGFFDIPHLVIYLCNPPPDDFVHESPMLAVKNLDKIEEYEHFKKHNLPCLPIEEFRWGMELDPEIYSEWVVLKPQNVQSTGKDVNMVPTKLVPTLKLSDFPEDHLINQDSYYVQRLLKTGQHPKINRATVFLGEILYSLKGQLNSSYPNEDSSLNLLLSKSIATNQHHDRTFELVKDDEVNQLALKIASTFRKNPLLAIDILRDETTGKLYVLEVNLGGNTWHFSSALAKKTPGYNSSVRKAMILQYNAWDRAAEALVKKAYELAA